MTKSGGRRHLKRPATPKVWPIDRKGSKWVSNIKAGPHGKKAGMPLVILIRDVLKLGVTSKEIKYMLVNNFIKVDGTLRKDKRFPIGHMDVLNLVPMKQYYRIQYHSSRKLQPFLIEKSEAKLKLTKITGKRNLRGGYTQISLHDSRNIRLQNEDARLQNIKVNDTLKITIPDQKILDSYKLEEGSFAMVTEGRHQGKLGKILEINKTYGPRASQVTFQEFGKNEGEEFSTALDYVFVLGKDKIELTIQS